jgi:hypothetical protein
MFCRDPRPSSLVLWKFVTALSMALSLGACRTRHPSKSSPAPLPAETSPHEPGAPGAPLESGKTETPATVEETAANLASAPESVRKFIEIHSYLRSLKWRTSGKPVHETDDLALARQISKLSADPASFREAREYFDRIQEGETHPFEGPKATQLAIELTASKIPLNDLDCYFQMLRGLKVLPSGEAPLSMAHSISKAFDLAREGLDSISVAEAYDWITSASNHQITKGHAIEVATALVADPKFRFQEFMSLYRYLSRIPGSSGKPRLSAVEALQQASEGLEMETRIADAMNRADIRYYGKLPPQAPTPTTPGQVKKK